MVVAKSDEVYLVQGQRAAGKDRPAGAVIEQRVVVAASSEAMMAALAKAEPGFRPVGWATLADYERTARRLRASLKPGSAEAYPVVVAEGMMSP
jgi:hypothetical protein